MKLFPKIQNNIGSLNNSRFFAGIVMLMLNLGSKYVSVNLSKTQEEFLKALNKVASGGKYFTGDVSAIIMKNFVNGTTTSVTPKQAPVETPFKLTKREKQILSLVLQLKNNKDIAEELEISKRTAEVHRFNLMKKLDVKNLLELSNKAKEFGLV